MNPKLFFVLLLICAAMTNALAQQFLVLEKMGTKKRFEYYPGEEITFKTPDEDYFTRGGIRGFGDSLIILSDRSVHIKSIIALNIKDHKDRTFVSRLGPYLMVAGSLLMIFDVVNQTAIQGGSYEGSAGVYVSAGVLIGAGAVMTFARSNKKKLDKWWRLRLVKI